MTRLVLVLLCATGSLAAQESLDKVLADVLAAGDDVELRDLGESKEAFAREIQRREQREAVVMAAREALRRHRFRLREGEGLYFRGRLHELAGDPEAAYRDLYRYVENHQSGDHYHDSLLYASRLSGLHGQGPAHGLYLFRSIDPEDLSTDEDGAVYRATRKLMEQYEVRRMLHGRNPPGIEAIQSMGNDHRFETIDGFDLGRYTGEPVLLVFFTPWLKPCRDMLREMVALRDEHPGTQLVAVTGITGRTLDLSSPGTPVDQAPVAKADSPGVELAMLEVLNERMELEDFPVLVERRGHSRRKWGVIHHPTVFVLGRDGRVVGHVVAHGPANRERVEKLLGQALAN